MTSDQHEELRKLTSFQLWLGTVFTTLPTDSIEMTKRARMYIEYLKLKNKTIMGRNKLPQGEKLGVLRVQIKEKYLTKELIPKLKIVAEKAVLEHLKK